MRYLFGSYALDIDRLELSEDGAPRLVEPQVFDLLRCLIERRERVVGADELINCVWRGRIVSDAALSSRVRDARRAIGDDGSAQRWIRTIRGRGFRFVGAVETRDSVEALAADDDAPPRQELGFRHSADGTRVAYAIAGDGPPLVKAANWLTHLEFDWESPVWRHFFRELTRERRLVRYDARGNGLSAWDVTDFSMERQIEDLETVVEAAGLERFALFGMSQGCAKAVSYAARHPDRVTKLVLLGGFARGWRHRPANDAKAVGEALCALIRCCWGRDNPAIQQMLTTMYMPNAPVESKSWFTDLQKKTTSPENAVEILSAHGALDIRPILPKVQAPTLVLHARNDVGVPYAEGQELAAGIPNARFVTLETANHILPVTDPAFARSAELIREFLDA